MGAGRDSLTVMHFAICALFLSLSQRALVVQAQEAGKPSVKPPKLSTENSMRAEKIEGENSSIDGEKIYRTLCMECHGEQGEPPSKIKSLFSPPPRDLRLLAHHRGISQEQVKRVIREGSGQNMLPFRDRLTEAQIEAVASYLSQLPQTP